MELRDYILWVPVLLDVACYIAPQVDFMQQRQLYHETSFAVILDSNLLLMAEANEFSR